MDGELAGKTFSARGFDLGAQAFLVAEVGEDSVDRLHVRGDGAGEAQ